MEEEIIYEIIDSIVNNQDKISELSHKIEFPSEDEIYQKESLYKKYLSRNIKIIKHLEKQKKINEINLHKFKNISNLKLEEIDDTINKINDQLYDFQNNNNNTKFYKTSFEKTKYLLLSNENEENLNILNNKYKDINLKYDSLLKNIKIAEISLNKSKEIQRMLEEEKEGVKLKLIEYMSLKESYEEIAKIQLKLFIFENMNNYNYPNTERWKSNQELNGAKITFDEKDILNKNENKEKISDIRLNLYEINNIDINNLGIQMSSQIINLINNYISLNLEQNELINVNSNNDLYNSSCLQKINNTNYMNTIIDENYINNNLNSIIKKSKIQYNKSDIKSLISILSSKIIKQIVNFISSLNNSIQNNNLELLLKSLNESITSFISIYYPSYIKINLNNSSDLILYIKYIIKSFYYEKIISSELLFLNEDYKNNHKAINNFINSSEEYFNKLKIQKDEYSLYKKKLEEKLNNLNEEKNNTYINLSNKEMRYIELNQKLNDLIKEKKQIKYDLIVDENENNFNNEKIINKIENLKNDNILLHKNILACQEEINLKNKQREMEISKLKKSIKGKYNLVKNQLFAYKKKHGDNIELYNKFIDKISETLRITNGTINNNNDYNLFMNTQSTFDKTNERRKLKKWFYTPEKIKINSNYKKLNF